MTLKEIKERQVAREWADVEAIARAIAPKARENARLRREKERREARRIQAEAEYLSRTGTVLKVLAMRCEHPVYRRCVCCQKSWNVSCIYPGPDVYVCPVCERKQRRFLK